MGMSVPLVIFSQVYKCTPSHLDDHRDCFTLDVSSAAADFVWMCSPDVFIVFDCKTTHFPAMAPFCAG